MDAPEAPAEIPDDFAARLQGFDAETLFSIACYAEALGESKSQDDDPSDESDASEPVLDEQGDELPDDIPSKASLVQKEINDNRYWYYQWREGDTVTSEYKGPAEPDS